MPLSWSNSARRAAWRSAPGAICKTSVGRQYIDWPASPQPLISSCTANASWSRTLPVGCRKLTTVASPALVAPLGSSAISLEPTISLIGREIADDFCEALAFAQLTPRDSAALPRWLEACKVALAELPPPAGPAAEEALVGAAWTLGGCSAPLPLGEPPAEYPAPAVAKLFVCPAVEPLAAAPLGAPAAPGWPPG